MNISCIVLAGGKSRRMGMNKSVLLIKNKPLILHVLEKVEKIFSDIIIVVKNSKQKKILKKILNKKIKIVEDKNRVYSPIAGIKEGIKHVKNKYVFIIACDTPFVSEKTIKKLLAKAKRDVDCVVYSFFDKLEPLCAVYKKSFFENVGLEESLTELIRKTKNKILIPTKNTKEFFNINTKKDLKIAEKW